MEITHLFRNNRNTLDIKIEVNNDYFVDLKSNGVELDDGFFDRTVSDEVNRKIFKLYTEQAINLSSFIKFYPMSKLKDMLYDTSTLLKCDLVLVSVQTLAYLNNQKWFNEDFVKLEGGVESYENINGDLTICLNPQLDWTDCDFYFTNKLTKTLGEYMEDFLVKREHKGDKSCTIEYTVKMLDTPKVLKIEGYKYEV